ncbi:MAG: glycosyltransferase family 1 protein [Patescibacteria group bacterium]
MKIVIDARKMRTSTGRYARELLTELEKIDSEDDYIIIGHSEDFKGAHSWTPTSKNFSSYVLDTPHYTLREQWTLWRTLRDLKPDLVHFWMPQQPLLYRGKKVSTVHDLNYIHLRIYNRGVLHYEFKRLIFKVFLRIISRRNDALIAPTNYTAKDLIDYTGVDPQKVFVTHEGTAGQVNPEKTKPVKKLVGKKYLMYVGQSSKYKGQLKIIKTLQRLRIIHKDLRLAIIGKPNEYTDKLKRIVKEHSYSGVDFLGFVSDEELSWAYSNAAAFVQASTSEGFGLMNLEAMVCGCPVVSSNATCLPEICGDAAHYFDPNNADEMYAAIDEVLSNEALRKRLVANGKKQVKNYSWSKMAKETKSVYDRILG